MVPACIVIRVLSVYVQHVRQNRALAAVKVPEIEMPSVIFGSPGALRDISSRVLRAMGWFDAVLLRYRFFSVRTQLYAALWCGSPWLIFYLVRLSTYPASRTLGAVGCRDDNAVFIAKSADLAFFGTALLPLYVRLCLTPDSLHLRTAVLVDCITAPAVAVWYLYFKLTPGHELANFTGNYAIVAMAIEIFLVSVWLPALLSFLPSERRAPQALLSKLSQHEASEISSEEPFSQSSAYPASQVHIRGSLPPSIAVVVGTADDDSLEQAVRSCAAARLITPLLSLREAARVLRMPGSIIASQSRALRVAAALLLAMPTGRALLFDTLAQEFCAEIVAFLVKVRVGT